MRVGRVVALDGPSAAGKTTISRAVSREIGAVLVGEAHLRLDPAPSLRYASDSELSQLERRLLRAESRRWEEVARLIERGRDVVMDTGPFGPISYTYGLVRAGRAPPDVFRELLEAAGPLVDAGRLGVPDLTLFLDVGLAERRRRARRAPRSHPWDLFARHTIVGHWERRLLLGGWRAPLSVERVAVPSGAPVARSVRAVVAQFRTARLVTASPARRRARSRRLLRAWNWQPLRTNHLSPTPRL